MLPKTHLLSGLFASLILYFTLPNISMLGLALFFLSSFLIDFDHYLYFLYEKGNFDPKGAIKDFKRKKELFKKLSPKERRNYSSGFYCFHGLEWIFIFIILGYFVLNLFYFIAAGMFLHLILDYIEIISSKKRFFKFSVIYELIKFKSLKKL